MARGLAALGIALIVGLAVSFVLAPTSGAGARCFSLVGEVPCDGSHAIGVGLLAAALAGVVVWWLLSRRTT